VIDPQKKEEFVKVYDGFKKQNENMLSFMIDRQHLVDINQVDLYIEQGQKSKKAGIGVGCIKDYQYKVNGSNGFPFVMANNVQHLIEIKRL
jgi:hypothetical protein